MLLNLFSNFLKNKMVGAFRDSEIFIEKEINKFPKDNLKILDLGCMEGVVIDKILRNSKKKYKLFGIDLINKKLVDKRIIYTKKNFENKNLPYASNSFDIIVCNQVIEHIIHKDKLIEECQRILKKGGICYMATENIASLDNIISLLFGQDPLTQSTSVKRYTGSFLSPHYMEKMLKFPNDYHMGHKNVCSYYGILRLFQINGFKNPQIRSFGHITKLFEWLFPFQNRIIVVLARK